MSAHLDELTTCPSCELMGPHPAVHVPDVENPDAGEHIADVMAYGRPEPIVSHYQPDWLPGYRELTCMFCERTWRQT